ncbi:MAG TPA: transcription termination factor Rho [Opitutaceae bacterium]|nr:transcription termination factor Rho [Opitutaceae bacterium]
MALPPKSDDDTPAAASADSDAGKKKSRLTRSRPRKPKAEKTEKVVEQSAPPIDEVREVPPPPPRESRQEESPPRAAAEPRAVFEPTTSAPAPSTDSAPPPAAGDSAPAPAPAPSGGQTGGGRPDWQHGGGGGQQDRGDRGFWKHGKRKRGRHGGGPWQPGGPGREQHPPQPPPPSNAPVFGDLPNPSRFADLAALEALAKELSSGKGDELWLHEIYALNLADLTAFAKKLGANFEGAPNKRQLLTEIFKFAAENKRTIRDRGYIDVSDRGSFVVHTHVNYRLYPEDPFLPDSLVRRYGLKRGHLVEVTIQPPQENERCPSVVRIDTVMGGAPDEISKVTPFEELVPYYPLQRILLEAPEIHPKDVSMRAVDILTPIGFGQRGLIVAPPRTGKTILLQNIANSISENSPEVKLILLLIDERPEEVTDFRRHTKGEVVSSTFDETPESHVHCAEMVIEICRRRVEQGEHVVVLLDSITRLARAYNALAGNQGKTMSGGLESNALQKPKRFFGSARNIEGGGSLTIIASALVDTGSRMDEIIFEEFKGTGNSELHLDRGLVERRIFPAINIDRSGTRKEELIYHPEELQRIYGLRRAMQGLGPIESMEMLITRLKKTKSNAEFLLSLAPK